jgi:flavin reductase (DIM6/NTAB) family NADH-FMN oxidoreductase RutF
MIEISPLVGGAQELRAAFGCFPSGVTAICAVLDGAPVGMAASSFTSVSVDPPLVSVCVQNTSTTWPRLRDSPRLGLSVLAEDHDVACLALSNKQGDRFAGVEWEAAADDAVYVRGSPLWLDCAVQLQVPAGDHTIVVLRVVGLRADPDRAPLVFHGSRFRTLRSIVE